MNIKNLVDSMYIDFLSEIFELESVFVPSDESILKRV